MPRSVMSPAGRIVEFFRSTPLETADLILGLCKDAVAARKEKSTAARARATAPATTLNIAVAAAPRQVKRRKKPGPKKGSKRKVAANVGVESEPGLPLVEAYGDDAVSQ